MIKKLHIDGFGKFAYKDVQLRSGINVIYGPNESGKTTIREFIFHMLFGLDKARGIAARSDAYTVYSPIYGGNYGGTMRLEIEQEEYVLQRKFRADERECIFFSEETNETKSLESVLGISESGYEDTFSIKSGDMIPSKQLAVDVTNYANNIFESGTTNIQVDKAVNYLKDKRRDKKRVLSEKEILLKNQRQRMTEPPKEEVKTVESYERTIIGLPFLLGAMVFLYLGISASYLLLIPGLFGAVIGSVLTLRKKKVVTYVTTTHDIKEELRKEYQKQKEIADQLSYDIRQINIAIDTILESANEIRNSFSGPLNMKVSEFIAEMTNGRYREIKIDESLSFMVKCNDRYIDMKYLSTGTIEQIYLAIRLAAGEILYPKAVVPILFDDIFGNFDEERMISTLEAVSKVTGKQVILFTCKESMLHSLNKLSQTVNWISVEESKNK
ncbi:MAG: AAA family ATPase [Anaerostipes sp.]|jgi:exonuclease SbcD|nr:AAA family ATPase [Anaerostipes sp.]MDD3746724.1 AAA family ATPase [Anaerostipes sp.]